MSNLKHLEGVRFGRLTVLSRTDQRHGSCCLWRCVCDCGRECLVDTYALTHGMTRSCGCLKDDARRTDLTGKHVGHLTAVAPTEKRIDGATVWLWRCDCGRVIEHTPIRTKRARTMCDVCAADLKAEQAEAARRKIARDEDGVSTKQRAAIRAGAPTAKNSSGIRGVSWHKGRGMWQARIGYHGRTITLGYFASLADAAKARHVAERIYHG